MQRSITSLNVSGTTISRKKAGWGAKFFLAPCFCGRVCTISWEQRKVKDIADNTYGGGTPQTSIDRYWNGEIPWIQSQDIIENQLFYVEPRKHISEEAISKSATKLVPKNSIAIVTRVGVGKLAFMPFSYCTSQDFLSLSGIHLRRLQVRQEDRAAV
ncbi:MAG: restriction endonuclease subunit S [Clostridia bacterium]|nr:restriction endonuclease subunit S [Clostridia bacterium]